MTVTQTVIGTPIQPRLRVVGLNAISPSMFTPSGQYVLRVIPTESLDELRNIFNKYTLEVMIDLRNVTWVHYIRHKPTLDVLRMVFPEFPEQPTGMVYKYAPGDVLIVATLKHGSRNVGPNATPDVAVSADDLIYWFVIVKHIASPMEMNKRKPQSLLDELLRKF
ncbi:MAG: hypothetical protein ACO2PN_21830 [Pyrobaculum sp.]